MKRKIIQKFTFPETQGVAALFAGSTMNGLPLKSIKRKNTNVTVTYEKQGEKHETFTIPKNKGGMVEQCQ